MESEETKLAEMSLEDDVIDFDDEMADETPPPDWLSELLQLPEEDEFIGLQSGDPPNQSQPKAQNDAELSPNQGLVVPVKIEECGTETLAGSQSIADIKKPIKEEGELISGSQSVSLKEEELADAPPPQAAAPPPSPPQMQEERKVIPGSEPVSGEEERVEDGPPPGWETLPPQPPSQTAVSPPQTAVSPPRDMVITTVSKEEGEMVSGFQSVSGEEEELDDGPPPGWDPLPPPPPQVVAPPPQAPVVTIASPSIPSKEEIELVSGSQSVSVKDEELDEGPPPGWQSFPPPTVAPPQTPAVTTSAFSVPIKEEGEMGSGSQSISIKDEELEDGPPPGWHSLPPQPVVAPPPPRNTPAVAPPAMAPPRPLQHIPATPPPAMVPPRPLQHTPASPQPTMAPPRPPQLSPAAPPPPPTPSDQGQMVCGSCHRLIFFPRPAKYVQCSCCSTVNLVLEEHQVGQVKCGKCAVLLMYPYGAPAVKCSSCHFVTEIGPHNQRPPLSEQQRRRRPARRPHQPTNRRNPVR